MVSAPDSRCTVNSMLVCCSYTLGTFHGSAQLFNLINLQQPADLLSLQTAGFAIHVSTSEGCCLYALCRQEGCAV